MVHFPVFARAQLWIHWAVRGFYPRGFPHSEIPGSKPACGSPRLIAACHVLHRLLAPRHPPYALSSLTIKLTQRVVLVAHPERVGTRTKKQMDKLAFPQIALLEQKFADYVVAVFRKSATRNASLIQLSKNFFSAPGGVSPCDRDAEGIPLSRKIKNPASSAGPNRPHTSGRLCAMLDCDLSCIRD